MSSQSITRGELTRRGKPRRRLLEPKSEEEGAAQGGVSEHRWGEESISMQRKDKRQQWDGLHTGKLIKWVHTLRILEAISLTYR